MKGEVSIAGPGGAGLDELKRCWKAWPERGLFLGLLGAWGALFQFLGNSTFGYVDTASLFGWLYNAYNSPGSDDGHGNLIPFVVLGLFWWRREELLAVPKRVWWPGLVMLAGAVLVHVAGYVLQQPRISVVGLFAGIFGLMGLAWGPAWLRASFFPFVLFVFCIPLGSLAEGITFPLRMVVAQATAWISNEVLGIAVVRDGSQIFSPSRSFNYDVAPACSGIRSLISLLALTVVYGFMTFRSAWRRSVMVMVAVPLAVVGNVVRLLGVVVAAEAFGQEAGAFVEQRLGFVTFAVALGCVLGLGWWLREGKGEDVGSGVAELKGVGGVGQDGAGGGGLTRERWVCLGLALVLMAGGSWLLVGLKSAQRLGEPGVRVERDGRGGVTKVELPERVAGFGSEELPPAPEEKGALPTDTTFGKRVYRAEDGFAALATVVLMGTDRTSIHKPQFCLTGQGWAIERTELVPVRVAGKGGGYELPVMKLTATKRVEAGGQMLVRRGIFVYWFVADGRVTAQHWERMWWMARDLMGTGVLQRWAYVTFFADCAPGEEEATFERLRSLVGGVVPELHVGGDGAGG